MSKITVTPEGRFKIKTDSGFAIEGEYWEGEFVPDKVTDCGTEVEMDEGWRGWALLVSREALKEHATLLDLEYWSNINE